MISEKAIIYSNVKLGENVTIEEGCIIGIPPKGVSDGEWETVIGDNSVIRAQTIIYAGNIIGKNFQTGNKSNIREKNIIGDDVSIGTLGVVEHHVKIESRVRIHTQVFVPEFSELCEGAWIGPNVVLTNAAYPLSPGVKENLKGPMIRSNAIIGANSTVLPGVTLGENSFVGAGSVVTKNVEDDSVVAGNPAKFLKKKSELPY